MLKQNKNSNTTAKLAVLSLILSGASLVLTVVRLCRKPKCDRINNTKDFDRLDDDNDEDGCEVRDLSEEDDFSFHGNADDLGASYQKIK